VNKYTLFQKAKNRYAPWPIEDVDDFFINTLKAKSLSLYDKDLEPFLIEHEIPQREKIGGVYGVYDLAITALLNGKVKSVNDMEFQQLAQKSVPLTDTDTILTIGSLVILETDNFKTVSGCYIGGTINRLYNLVAFFAGLPEVDKTNFENYIIDDYLSSLADVKTMGFFEL
jgi:hypothetical protein